MGGGGLPQTPALTRGGHIPLSSFPNPPLLPLDLAADCQRTTFHYPASGLATNSANKKNVEPDARRFIIRAFSDLKAFLYILIGGRQSKFNKRL